MEQLNEVQKAIEKVKESQNLTNKDLDGVKVSEVLEEAEKISDKVLETDKYKIRRVREEFQKRFTPRGVNKEITQNYPIFLDGQFIKLGNGSKAQIRGFFNPQGTMWQYKCVDDKGNTHYIWEVDLLRYNHGKRDSR